MKRQVCQKRDELPTAGLGSIKVLRKLHGPQRKILEGRANIRERIFKALFTYVSTRFGLRSFEKCFENTFPNVCSVFHNLRLGTMNFIAPKQPSATSPRFFDNLHFEHFDKSFHHESRLTLLSKCSKWRLSKNRGLVADGCSHTI